MDAFRPAFFVNELIKKIIDYNDWTDTRNVPNEILNPRNTWSDKNAYDIKLKQLNEAFTENFKLYE